MDNKIISVQNISKKYEIGMVASGSFRETFTNAISLSNKKRSKSSKDEFWALKDISFDVNKGDVIGIIGRNGAGKSTLLKVISKITEPTNGRIVLNGRVASLLEVGTGFHPELTGRENIFLNGSILGMTRSEIRSKFNEIVNFSGVEKFLDTPVKRYSSGMYVRLAFAVAAHLEPEILVIDEVLSVGDVEFQKKCLGKMNEVAKGGRTVLFVSHNMGAVRTLCETVIVLNGGKVAFQGDVETGVNIYLGMANENMSEMGQVNFTMENAVGKEELKLLGIRLKDELGNIKGTFSTSEEITLEIDYYLTEKVVNMRLNVRVLTGDDQILFAGSSHSKEPHSKNKGYYTCITKFSKDLLNEGVYKIWLQAGSPGYKELLPEQIYLKFTTEKLTSSGTMRDSVLPGYIAPVLNWEIITK
ncbi:MAG: polysaccharide ABC transporter ATP-binding protein [Saprospiraceae bacterium]|nr:polysaccharide ABC transporter ATP-binding protein [Saprospiraceae bacterium]